MLKPLRFNTQELILGLLMAAVPVTTMLGAKACTEHRRRAESLAQKSGRVTLVIVDVPRPTLTKEDVFDLLKVSPGLTSKLAKINEGFLLADSNYFTLIYKDAKDSDKLKVSVFDLELSSNGELELIENLRDVDAAALNTENGLANATIVFDLDSNKLGSNLDLASLHSDKSKRIAYCNLASGECGLLAKVKLDPTNKFPASKMKTRVKGSILIPASEWKEVLLGAQRV